MTIKFKSPAKQIIERLNNAECNIDEYFSDNDTVLRCIGIADSSFVATTMAKIQDPDDGFKSDLLIPTELIQSINI